MSVPITQPLLRSRVDVSGMGIIHYARAGLARVTRVACNALVRQSFVNT
jgi:hypothetical protein